MVQSKLELPTSSFRLRHGFDHNLLIYIQMQLAPFAHLGSIGSGCAGDRICCSSCLQDMQADSALLNVLLAGHHPRAPRRGLSAGFG
jgi:hypothetical protein